MIIVNYQFSIISSPFGGLAQLARAPALQAGGQRFESVILHLVVAMRKIVNRKSVNRK